MKNYPILKNPSGSDKDKMKLSDYWILLNPELEKCICNTRCNHCKEFNTKQRSMKPYPIL